MYREVDYTEQTISCNTTPVAGARTATPQAVGKGLTKFQTPVSNSLAGEGDAAHPHHLFDIAEALERN